MIQAGGFDPGVTKKCSSLQGLIPFTSSELSESDRPLLMRTLNNRDPN
jgi:hypothetical protein